MIRPLPKINPPREIGHLRPISILSASSKTLEADAHRQISEFVTERDLLDKLQSGFRKRHSTHTALILMVDNFRKAFDNKQVVLAVAIDYSVAFDCVNVALLIELPLLGCRKVV